MSGRPAPPSRLGRGLAALLGDAQAIPAGGGGTLPAAALEPGPFQPRMALDPEALAALTDSIRRQGVLQPVLARPHPAQPGRYQIIAGERRWRAAQAAGLHELPVLVRDLSDADAMAAALVENLQRDDLNVIEEAEGYRRLLDEFGLTQELLSDTVGKSRSYVANTLRLLHLPDAVRDHVRGGALSAGHARALVNHSDPEGAARAIISRGLSVRQTEALATQPQRESTASRRRDALKPNDPVVDSLARRVSECLGLRVEIAWDGRGGNVRVQYRDLEQLEGVCALLLAGGALPGRS
jgi:ParB family chromosome partitioning protein